MDGTLLSPDNKLKSAILDGLAEKIIEYKVYLSDSEFEEVNAEFKRIATINLQSKFFSSLDIHSKSLIDVYTKKGGVQGKKIKSIMLPITQHHIHSPMGVIVSDIDNSSQTAMAETVFGIFVIRHEGAEPGDDPENVGIILEGVEVLDELGNVSFAVAMMFALVYALNLSYPPELKFTFEALH
ncbi:hypothetical protein NQZ68_012576 [Dissostichus eleginoides]|nr:hypothetical protein NQZ68_012576 [Dissostichus eleginoides]